MTTRVQYKLSPFGLGYPRQRPLTSDGRLGKPDLELYLCPRCGAAIPPPSVFAKLAASPSPHDRLRMPSGTRRCCALQRRPVPAFSCWPPHWPSPRPSHKSKASLIISTVIVVTWRFLQAIGPPKV